MKKYNNLTIIRKIIFNPDVFIVGGIIISAISAVIATTNKIIFVFLGAVLTAIGGVLASYNSKNIENELKEKNNYIIANITGGDSYPFLGISNIKHNDNSALLFSHSEGEFPLYDVSYTVFDDDKNFDDISVDNLSMYQKVYNVGNISPKTTRLLEKMDLGSKDKRSFSVQSVARNGSFFQSIVLKRIKGKWKKYIKVSTMKNSNVVVLLEKKDEGFAQNEDGISNYKEENE